MGGWVLVSRDEERERRGEKRDAKKKREGRGMNITLTYSYHDT